MSNALVVGGTGFVGRNLIHFLKDETFEIDCLSTSEPSEARKVRGVNYLTANLQDYSSLERVLGRRQYRFVVNVGGYVDHRRFGSGGESVFATHFTGLVNLVSVVFMKIEKSVEVNICQRVSISQHKRFVLKKFSQAA